mgnify:CR=1 FL=1
MPAASDLAERFAHKEEFSHFVRDLHAVKTRMYAEMLNDGEVPLRPGVERLLNELVFGRLVLAAQVKSETDDEHEVDADDRQVQ